MREVSARYRRVANASGWLTATERALPIALPMGRPSGGPMDGGAPWQAASVTYDGGARLGLGLRLD